MINPSSRQTPDASIKTREDQAQGRPHLNFANITGYPNGPDNGEYPTTPSTFPQPVLSSAQQRQFQDLPGQIPYHGQPSPAYFPETARFPQQTAQQQQYSPLSPQRNPSPFSTRNVALANDPRNGLAQQLSHQNLGDNPRSPVPNPGQSSTTRSRYADTSQQQKILTHDSFQSHSPISQGPEFEAAPVQRTPDRYGSKANTNAKKCLQMAMSFFHDSVQRARERNCRYVPHR
jgi:protein-serine/threonine kinase